MVVVFDGWFVVVVVTGMCGEWSVVVGGGEIGVSESDRL